MITNRTLIKDTIITEELRMLHIKFVVALMDKRSFSVIQRHYAHVLINDLCLNYIHNITSTYMKAITPVNKTVSDNTSFLKI